MPKRSFENELGPPAAAFRPDERLAVYGSLVPGGLNAHILRRAEGIWLTGYVRGTLRQQGWAARLGHPGIRLVPGGDLIRVEVLCSRALPAMWAMLDSFEGADYRRVAAPVVVEEESLTAQIYELAAD